MTSRPAIGSVVLALAAVAAVVFVGVSVHEFNYAGDHPYAYGPAKVIALASATGAALSLAVGLLGWALLHDGAASTRR